MSTSHKNVVSHVRLEPGTQSGTTNVWTHWEGDLDEGHLRFPNDVIDQIVSFAGNGPRINGDGMVGENRDVQIHYNSAGLLVWNTFIPMQVFLDAVKEAKPTPKVGEIWEGYDGTRYIVSEIQNHPITRNPIAVVFNLGTGSRLHSISVTNTAVFGSRVQGVQV